MLSRRHIPITLFVAAYMAVAAVAAIVRANREFVVYGVVMLALIGLILLLDRRVRLSTPLLWGLALWGLLHMAGGLVRVPAEWTDANKPGVLYNLRLHPSLPKYDQLVHAYGFGVATLAAWRALVVASGGTLRPTAGVLVGMVCIGMGLGALNEVVEFAATLTLPDTNVGGYENTGWDLVSNLVGCVIAAAIIRWSGRGNDKVTATAGER